MYLGLGKKNQLGAMVILASNSKAYGGDTPLLIWWDFIDFIVVFLMTVMHLMMVIK